MKYYKLIMDDSKKDDIICHSSLPFNIDSNIFQRGEIYTDLNARFEFYYDVKEGSRFTDYLANDNGWLLVSERLRDALMKLNTDIQFFPALIKEKKENGASALYFIANVIRVVDAICLEHSNYFETDLPGIGTIPTISKYAIYHEKTHNSDMFKLKKWQNTPIFVSERFYQIVEIEKLTGMDFSNVITV